ncbi:MAG: hypothetical protein ACLQVM_24330 [Terriglobia bacterium]
MRLVPPDMLGCHALWWSVKVTGKISTDRSRIMGIPTNEELLIARDTFRLVRDVPIPS